MIRSGILNPQLLALLARVRHTNLLVIADRGFQFQPHLETVDLALTDDLPTVLQVLAALRGQSHFGQAFMASEFREHNAPDIVNCFARALEGIPCGFEAHEAAFKPRLANAIGLIRTGDTVQYANLLLVSA